MESSFTSLLLPLWFCNFCDEAAGESDFWNFSLTPSSLSLDNFSARAVLTVTCGYTANVTLRSLTVERNVTGTSDRQVLGRLDARGRIKTGEIVGIFVTNNFNSTRTITITLSQAGCVDAGSYTCIVVHTPPNSTQSQVNTTHLELIVEVRDRRVASIVMDVYPAFFSNPYYEYTVMKLACVAILPDSFRPATQQISWIWRRKKMTWENYDGHVRTDHAPTRRGCARVAQSVISIDALRSEHGTTYSCTMSTSDRTVTDLQADWKLAVNTRSNRLCVLFARTEGWSRVQIDCKFLMLRSLQIGIANPLRWTLVDRVDGTVTHPHIPFRSHGPSGTEHYYFSITSNIAMDKSVHGDTLSCYAHLDNNLVLRMNKTVDIYNLENYCKPNPCQHGGRCREDRAYCNLFKCSCRPGYKGSRCETDIDECASDPCQNEGTCSNEVNHFKCSCHVGFVGMACETDINECASSPCRNGGSCHDHVNRYQCTCLLGYRGENCQEEIDECASGPCQNEGTCSDEVNHFTCSCNSDFVGSLCENAVPGELYISCRDYIQEFEDLNCACSVRKPGHPPPRIWWEGQDNSAFSERRVHDNDTLFVQRVQRNQTGTQYTCRMSWAEFSEFEVKYSKTYTLLVAYGPTDADTVISQAPANPVATDGDTRIRLICTSREAVPSDTIVWWTLAYGQQCERGNRFRTCTFSPDPSLALEHEANCKLTNKVVRTFTGNVAHTVKLEWDGTAAVRAFSFDGLKGQHVARDAPGEVLTLSCFAVGRPAPAVNVYRLAKVNSTARTGGSRLRAREKIERPNRRTMLYSVTSPACGLTDTYRCDASNSDVTKHSKFVTLHGNCTTQMGKQQKTDTVLVGLVSAGGVLAASILLLTLFGVCKRRIKKKELAAQKEDDSQPDSQPEGPYTSDRWTDSTSSAFDPRSFREDSLMH